MKRQVREDQHGTNTGYTYGCRCEPCRAAASVYRKSMKPKDEHHGTLTGYHYGCRCGPCRMATKTYHETPHVRAELVSEILDVIRAEADLDDIATVTGERLAESVGCSRVHAQQAVRVLIESGRVAPVGRVGRGGVMALQVAAA